MVSTDSVQVRSAIISLITTKTFTWSSTISSSAPSSSICLPTCLTDRVTWRLSTWPTFSTAIYLRVNAFGYQQISQLLFLGFYYYYYYYSWLCFMWEMYNWIPRRAFAFGWCLFFHFLNKDFILMLPLIDMVHGALRKICDVALAAWLG